MTIDDLIRIAWERSPRTQEIEAAARHAQVTVVRLYDLFAKSVATRYLRGELSYTDGDAAMNGLFGYAYPGGGQEFDRLAWQVYLAFDEGEHVHAGEPIESQGEAKTRALLAKIAELTDA
jgi:hypothetical protein